MYVVADTFGRVAVMANAVDLARGLDVEACRVDWAGRRTGARKGALYVLRYLVEADDKDYFLGSEGYGGYAVAVAVDVDYHAVLAYCVDARQVKVGREGLAVYSLGLVAVGGKVTVEHVKVTFVQGLGQSHVTYCHRPAPRYAASVGYEGRHFLHRLGRSRTVEGLEVTPLKVLYNLLGKPFVAYFLWCHNAFVFKNVCKNNNFGRQT